MAGVGETTGSGHFGEESLVWFFYGEAENTVEIDLHLALCAECRTRYEALKADMNALASYAVPEPGPDYAEQVWRSLVRRDASIGSSRRVWWRRWLAPRQVTAAALSAALVAAAFFAGRVAERVDRVDTAALSEVARERLLAVALSEHIEQSHRTIVELVNADPGATVDISSEQSRAETLLAGNRLYRQAAQRQGHTALAGVLEDLERVLLEVAHAPGKLSSAEAKRLRERIEEQELVFRLRVIDGRLEDLQRRPVPKTNSEGKRI
ncbi:MAG TPA: hypothetical protein VES20_09415 [Bryobacteraceae bacterium]|nr:hypothetical protein [Bryobacteraceae bacterium]